MYLKIKNNFSFSQIVSIIFCDFCLSYHFLYVTEHEACTYLVCLTNAINWTKFMNLSYILEKWIFVQHCKCMLIIFPSVFCDWDSLSMQSPHQWPWKYHFLVSCICYLIYFLYLSDSFSLLTFYFLFFEIIHNWKAVQISHFIKTLYNVLICSFTSTIISLDFSLNFGSCNFLPPDAMFTNFQLNPWF